MKAITLKIVEYSFEKFGYMKPPEPSPNGGLYTGEPFKEGSAYADVKVTPDAFFMNNFTLALRNLHQVPWVKNR